MDPANQLADHRHSLRQQALAAATDVWNTVVGGYGPFGSHRLLDMGDEVRLLRSSARGLTERPMEAAFQPYQKLAMQVSSSCGDQSTLAVLIASGIVKRILADESGGLQRANFHDGLQAAKRQTLALLRSYSKTNKISKILGSVHNDTATIEAVVTGLAQMQDADGAALDLERIHVHVDETQEIGWADGCLIQPQTGPEQNRVSVSDAKVMLTSTSWPRKPRGTDATMRIVDATLLPALYSAEAAQFEHELSVLRELDVRVWLCGGKVDDGFATTAATQGIWIYSDAPTDVRRRISAACGATEVSTPGHAHVADLGTADVRPANRRRSGLWLVGPGQSCTLLLHAHSQISREAVAEGGERLLRAAATVLQDSGGLPGGGRWQRQIASSLQLSKDKLAGRASMVVQAVANVFDDAADTLVANSGSDPLTHILLPDANSIVDSTACVVAAVDAAFDVAGSILRVDGSYRKVASSGAALRGGTGPAGSPKGMPGDIPPLM